MREISSPSVRFAQGATAGLLLAAFVPDWRPMVALVALALSPEAAGQPAYGPFRWLYSTLLRPRFGHVEEPADDSSGLLMARVALVGLALACVAFLAGHAGLAWVAALLVAALGALLAATGLCPACDLYAVALRRPRAPEPERP